MSERRVPHSDDTHLEPARVRVSKAGTRKGERPEINLIEGTNVTLTVADNPASQRTDVTITAAGGGGGPPTGPAGGELAGTYPNPTVVATHSGSAHHAEDHAIDGAHHTGTLNHSALGAVTSDQHHNKSHGHTGGDGSGTVGHGDLTGISGVAAGFDNTALAGQFVGLSINNGAAGAWTVETCFARLTS